MPAVPVKWQLRLEHVTHSPYAIRHFHRPDVIGDLMRHGRGNPQGIVDAAKVVIGVPEGDCGPVVLPLLAECVGKARESTLAHSEAQIAALDD